MKTTNLIALSILGTSLCGCATFAPKQSYTPPSAFVQKSKVSNDCVSNACRKKAFFAIGPGPTDYLHHEGYADKKLGQVSTRMGNVLGDTMVGASTGAGVSNPLGLALFITGVLTSSSGSLPLWAEKYRWISIAMSKGQVFQIIYPYSPRNGDIAYTRKVMASVMATDLKILQWVHFDHGLAYYHVMGSAYSIQAPGHTYDLYFVGTSKVNKDGAFSTAWWTGGGDLLMRANIPYCRLLDQTYQFSDPFYLASAVGVLIPGLHGEQALAVSTFVVKHPFTFYGGTNTLRNLSKAFPDAYVDGFANFCHDGHCQS